MIATTTRKCGEFKFNTSALKACEALAKFHDATERRYSVSD